MVAGSVYWSADREKRKELEGVVSEAKRKEKLDKWVKELEARDEEDKAMRAELRRAKEGLIGRSDSRSVVEACERRGMGLGILQSVVDLTRGR